MKINQNYNKLPHNYLFTEIALRTEKYIKTHPTQKVIKLGIGDVTQPLSPVIANAMKQAVEELTKKETFRGYGPELGHVWARQSVADYYKNEMNVVLDIDEITIGDGIGEDLANITDLFNHGGNTVVIQDPVYPLYQSTTLMDSNDIIYVPCNEANGFLPTPPDSHSDIIYLCSPNNPTGAAFNFSQLKAWVDYALENNAIILFDAAYERFTSNNDCPRSIFQIEGARNCAIEFGSLSKTAGFSCIRSGYTIVPNDLNRDGMNLLRMWQQRQTTKYNGANYITQRGLEAALTPQGLKDADRNIAYYHHNAGLITSMLKEKGLFFTGGESSPYVWLKCPNGMKSWDFFQYLLDTVQVIGTPGVGFGPSGEGYFRLSAFNSTEQTIEALERLDTIL
ncbi:MAG: LL-diaminopimelate aminotransferase [Bacteroidales bacterium]|nr:LL-diaminopimelate aminotransferase [Bacteroidales bacterium]